MSNLGRSAPDTSWGELAPCEHLVHFHEDDDAFLESLTGFVADGLARNEGVIIIATPPHLLALEDRLEARAVNVDRARLSDQYLTFDAEATLARFMERGWPDEQKFSALVRAMVARAKGRGRPVRAFGEMVALLWARGHADATVQLEHLWQRICREESFALYCAYPKTGFGAAARKSMADICAAHSRVMTPRCEAV